MGMYGPKPIPAKKSPRWGHKAYAKKPGKVWTGADEGFLKREFLEFNNNPSKIYIQFLKQVAYALGQSEFKIRAKLKELRVRGVIPGRKH